MSEQSYGQGTSVVNPLEGGNPYFGNFTPVAGILPPVNLPLSLDSMAICLELSPDKLLEDVRQRDVVTLKIAGKHFITLAWLASGAEPKPYSATQDGRAKNGRRKKT